MQLVFLGIIGEYVGRIYFEAKRRPHFVVAELSDGLRTVPPRPRHSPRVPARQTRLVDNIVATDAVPTAPSPTAPGAGSAQDGGG